MHPDQLGAITDVNESISKRKFATNRFRLLWPVAKNAKPHPTKDSIIPNNGHETMNITDHSKITFRAQKKNTTRKPTPVQKAGIALPPFGSSRRARNSKKSDGPAKIIEKIIVFLVQLGSATDTSHVHVRVLIRIGCPIPTISCFHLLDVT
jgi:hypothetical protein